MELIRMLEYLGHIRVSLARNSTIQQTCRFSFGLTDANSDITQERKVSSNEIYTLVFSLRSLQICFPLIPLCPFINLLFLALA
jgi:hypothetical protein